MESEYNVMETAIIVIVVGAALFFVGRKFVSTAKGKSGCSCGGCEKKCAARDATGIQE